VIASASSVHGRARKPKVAANREQSNAEFAGLRAGVGYSAVLIAVTFG
jgi:hypothetical protein